MNRYQTIGPFTSGSVAPGALLQVDIDAAMAGFDIPASFNIVKTKVVPTLSAVFAARVYTGGSFAASERLIRWEEQDGDLFYPLDRTDGLNTEGQEGWPIPYDDDGASPITDAALHFEIENQGAAANTYTYSFEIEEVPTFSATGDVTFRGSITGDALIAASAGPTSARQHTIPNVVSDVFALVTAAQTLLNKTLTSPTINGGALSGTLSGSPTLSGSLIVNNSLTIGVTGGQTGLQTIKADGIAWTTQDGLVLSNSTAATAGVKQQIPPRIRFTGNIWNQGSVASNQSDWTIAPSSWSQASSTGSLFQVFHQLNGGGYVAALKIGSDIFSTGSGQVNIGISATGAGVAVGESAQANNYEAVAIGPRAIAENLATIAIGDQTRAQGDNSIVMGDVMVQRAGSNVVLLLGGGTGTSYSYINGVGVWGSNTGFTGEIATADHQGFFGWYESGGATDGIGYNNDNWFGGPVTATAPQPISFNITSGSGTNIAGVDWTFNASRATGNATPGQIKFATTTVGGSGATLQTLVDRLTIASTLVTIQPTLNLGSKLVAYNNAAPVNGQLLIGSTSGGTWDAATLTGTANQVVVTNGGGTITLSTPQSIGTASTPTFSRVFLGDGLVGAPSLSFTSDGDSGLYFDGTQPAIAHNGVRVAAFSTTAGLLVDLIQIGGNTLSIGPNIAANEITGAEDNTQFIDFRGGSGTTGGRIIAYGPSHANGGLLYLGSQISVRLLASRLDVANGAAVASANNLTLGAGGNTFHITGSTQINLLSAVNWQGGPIVLIFDSNPTVKHDQAVSGDYKPIKLRAGADFVASAGVTLSLVFDGTAFYQI